ncbi:MULTISPECIES: winged helix-turn-helix domain-containing protein [Bacillaceae]|uniref:Winged helix-turn-helix domain-containing protein n=1 Tax=Evansella alkalicola TaxID=745819 RepID=A0ABS6JS29_9BACI|nr:MULTISPECIES: winged helix-turn-helix domain-containing protein [Bacillaceae]MBU9721376.1 winged helix-turn-helix domain-containing protein [Bacillus alkalicola]
MLFSLEDYSVTDGEEKVKLLRKEYLLLSYLYKNKGRVFSREELLNAVWSMEEPTDRTVDDHVYRLRKKLSPFTHTMTIKTVKGYGYLLEVQEEPQIEAALPIPEELSNQANQLFNMYYKYGHGKALKALLTNKELGFSLKADHQATLHLLQSEFEHLLNSISSHDNKFIPLYLYAQVEQDPKKVISTYEKVVKSKVLVEKEEMDVQYGGLPMLYLKIDKPAEAMKMVKKGLAYIRSDEKHGFYPLLKIMKSIVHFYNNEMEKAEAEIDMLEILLKDLPYQRELGALHVIKGLLIMATGDTEQAKEWIENGRSIINDSGHSYYFLFIYSILDTLLPKAKADKNIAAFYDKEKKYYYKQTNLLKLKRKIMEHIQNFL